MQKQGFGFASFEQKEIRIFASDLPVFTGTNLWKARKTFLQKHVTVERK